MNSFVMMSVLEAANKHMHSKLAATRAYVESTPGFSRLCFPSSNSLGPILICSKGVYSQTEAGVYLSPSHLPRDTVAFPG